MRRGGSLRSVAWAVWWRATHHYFTNPALLVPSVVFPLFFLVAFAGGLSGVGDVPGFDFPSGYTTFQFVFVLLQASAFGGVFMGFGVAADFESGFTRRLLLAAPNRLGLLAGWVLAALTRATFVVVLLFAVGLLFGVQVDGGVVDVVRLILLAYLVSLTAALFALGVAFRARSIQAGPAMQMPVFLLLFLAPVFVPLDLLTGWVKGVAQVNPITALLTAGRDLISGQPADVLLAYGCALALVAVFGVWALTGLRRAERAG